MTVTGCGTVEVLETEPEYQIGTNNRIRCFLFSSFSFPTRESHTQLPTWFLRFWTLLSLGLRLGHVFIQFGVEEEVVSLLTVLRVTVG